MATDLTVVVVALNAPELLPRCLDALVSDDPQLGVVVVRDWGGAGGPGPEFTRRFPRVHWVSAPTGTTVPVLRSLGIAAAQGRLVALLEDDCLVQAGWARHVRLAHDGPAAAVGGAVVPDTYRRGLDWAVFFCEYGRFMPPLPSTDTTDLAGMNVAYKRDALAGLAVDPEGFRDYFVHQAWAAKGQKLCASQTFVVKNVNSWQSRHLVSWPYHHGRAFAGQRFSRASVARRVAFAAAAVAVLPWLKTGRLAAIVMRRGRYAGPFIMALPWVLLFNTAWTWGEVVGSLGGPGTSASRWR